jgi:hypothetical protein
MAHAHFPNDAETAEIAMRKAFNAEETVVYLGVLLSTRTKTGQSCFVSSAR